MVHYEDIDDTKRTRGAKNKANGQERGTKSGQEIKRHTVPELPPIFVRAGALAARADGIDGNLQSVVP